MDNTKTPANVDYTTIAERLRTVSWSNMSHLIRVVKIHFINKLTFCAKMIIFQKHGDGNYRNGGIRCSHSYSYVSHVDQRYSSRATRWLISINVLYE